MKTNILKKSILALACAFALGLTSQANALSIGDAYYVGWFDPATPASDTAEVAGINQLIGLTIGLHTISSVQFNHVALTGLPDALVLGGSQGGAPA
jgi:hypothetical protein